MNKREWIEKAAERYMKQASIEPGQAKEMAHVLFDKLKRHNENPFLKSPSDAVDDELESWTQ